VSWTKRELIAEALTELGLQGYEFDTTPEEQQTALRRLDTLLGTWEAKGVRVGYAFPATPGASDLDDESGLPDSAVETVYLNLAIRLAPTYGKAVSAMSKKAAREGYDALLWQAAQPQNQQLRAGMPAGAGNKGSGLTRSFLPPPTRDPLPVGRGGDLIDLPE
jgi:hypothetical protein